MAALTTILAGVGIAAGVVGAGVQAYGQMQAADAQKRSAAIQQQQESLRRRAADLDSQRKQMSIIREQQKSRAMALAAATNQGAAMGSGLQGGYGQIQGTGGEALVTAKNNQEMGGEMFALNGAKFGADKNAAAAGTMASFGSGISSLGGSLTNKAGTIAKIGGSLFG